MFNKKIDRLQDNIQTLTDCINKLNKRVSKLERNNYKNAKSHFDFRGKLKCMPEATNINLNKCGLLMEEKNITEDDIITFLSVFELKK